MKTKISLMLLLLSHVVFAQVTNLRSGVWSDQTIWSNNLLPSDTTNVSLNFNIVIDIGASCKSLQANGHSVTIAAGVAFNVDGTSTDAIDIDGNVYPTVAIGTQRWISKNLAVSHYKNGDTIPEVGDSASWLNLTTGAWCYYEHNTANGMLYGKLYNWYAVNDPRGLAPDGWHIPSDAEWTVLTDFLGVGAGDQMKEADRAHWTGLAGNTGNNSSGFTGLPGGYRSDYLGMFFTLGDNGFWWSSSEVNSLYAWNRFLDDTDICTKFYGYKIRGYSVRCVKD